MAKNTNAQAVGSSVLTGVLFTAIVQWVMTRWLKTDGYGADFHGVQLEALLAGLVGLFFGDAALAKLKPILSLLSSLFGKSSPDSESESDSDVPTPEEAKAAIVLLNRVMTHNLVGKQGELRDIAVSIGIQEYGNLVPPPKSPEKVSK